MSGSRRYAVILAAVLFAASTGQGQQESASAVTEPGNSPGTSPEFLDYSIEWRLIPAGTARFSWTPLQGSTTAASEIRLHLESTGIVSRVFHVSDDYTAMLAANYCGTSTFMTTHEGSRNHETRVSFDQQGRKARSSERDLVKNTTTTNEVDIMPCTHDILGALMKLRTLRLEPGKSTTIPVSDGHKAAPVKVESQRREDIETGIGTRRAIRYEIFAFDNVIFKRFAHLHVWLSDDAQRLPLQIEVHLQFAIGTITFRLEKQGGSATIGRGSQTGVTRQ